MIKPQDILVLVKLISIENQHQIFKEYYSEAQLEWDKLEDEQLDIFLKLSAFYDSLSIRGLAEAVVISKSEVAESLKRLIKIGLLIVTSNSPFKRLELVEMIYAELSGDFPLGDSKQPTYKSLRPFDLVS